MINSRDKGKRIERAVASMLRPFFPNVQRNANAQSQGSSGVDLVNTEDWDFEVKGGNNYQTGFYRHMQNWLKQIETASSKGRKQVVVYVPDKKGGRLNAAQKALQDKDTVIMSMDTFKLILKENGKRKPNNN